MARDEAKASIKVDGEGEHVASAIDNHTEEVLREVLYAAIKSDENYRKP